MIEYAFTVVIYTKDCYGVINTWAINVINDPDEIDHYEGLIRKPTIPSTSVLIVR